MPKEAKETKAPPNSPRCTTLKMKYFRPSFFEPLNVEPPTKEISDDKTTSMERA